MQSARQPHWHVCTHARIPPVALLVALELARLAGGHMRTGIAAAQQQKPAFRP